MKIGIDCRLAGSEHAGIGRYIDQLVNHLVKDTKSQWILFFSNKKQAQSVLPTKLRNQKHISIVYAPIKHYTLREQLLLPGIIAKQKLDLLHVPHFNIPIFYFGKMVVTIHDLLWHDHRGNSVTALPVWQYWLKYIFYRLITRAAAGKSSQIIVPSNTIKQTLINYYPKSSKKINIIKEGFPQSFQEFAKKIGSKSRNSKQLLYVGSLYPHKNVELVLRSLVQLPDYKLVIAGSRSIFMKQTERKISKLNLKDRVIITGYVDDFELTKLYLKSAALVQPSLSEGFGLTGLEALSLQTPVLASDIPIFREIYQDAAIYFDPRSVDSFTSAIKQLEKLNTSKFAKKAKDTASEYSWKDMSEKTLEIYKSVLKFED